MILPIIYSMVVSYRSYILTHLYFYVLVIKFLHVVVLASRGTIADDLGTIEDVSTSTEREYLTLLLG